MQLDPEALLASSTSSTKNECLLPNDDVNRMNHVHGSDLASNNSEDLSAVPRSASKNHSPGVTSKEIIIATEEAHGNSIANDTNANDYQQLVEKLHALGNEPRKPSCVDNQDIGNTPVLSNQELSSPCRKPITTNGTLDTPPNTPTLNECDCEQLTKSVKSLVILKDEHGLEYIRYRSERQMPDIMSLISKDLSEPYSIYTYRYFIHNWPELCFLVSVCCVVLGYCIVSGLATLFAIGFKC